VQQDELHVYTKEKEFKVGEVAEFFVECGWTPADGLLTVHCNGIIDKISFPLTEVTTSIKIPIKPAYAPSVRIQVDAAGKTDREDVNGAPSKLVPPRPALASGFVDIKVLPKHKELSVIVTPDDPKLPPGCNTIVNVCVTDVNGIPVSSCEVALVVVDESVLALTKYKMKHPVETFFVKEMRTFSKLNRFALRKQIRLIDIEPDKDKEKTRKRRTRKTRKRRT